jgi:hypothetical protein
MVHREKKPKTTLLAKLEKRVGGQIHPYYN